MTSNRINHANCTNHTNHIDSPQTNRATHQPSSSPHHHDLLDEELAVEALIEDLRQPSLNAIEKQRLSEEVITKLNLLCKAEEVCGLSAKISSPDQKLTTPDAGNKAKPTRFTLPKLTTTITTCSLGTLTASLLQLLSLEPAFAAATLNFDQGIADGVNPIIKLVLTHNGKAIFLSSAIGMLLGGGNNDGWARLKMGGMWAVGAAALIHIMKGTLGVAMPG